MTEQSRASVLRRGPDVRRRPKGQPVLLDVNVLVALAWPNHVHHSAAHAWFDQVGRAGFATCSVTQSGFVRVSSNRRAIPDARSPREAREILRRITDLPGHAFWTDDTEIASSEHIAWERLGSHAQVTMRTCWRLPSVMVANWRPSTAHLQILRPRERPSTC